MHQKKILFRVDASIPMGSGHFMRCMTLAKELKARDVDVHFACRHLPDSYSVYLLNSQIHLYKIKNSVSESITSSTNTYLNWLGVSQETDANDTINLVGHINWDWIIVDHYALNIEWESKLKPLTKRLMTIDDLHDRAHLCDLLLNQNYYEPDNSIYKDNIPSNCKLLLGPNYALLRNEFLEQRKRVNRDYFKISRILVFMGGVDHENYTGIALDSLLNLSQDYKVDVVIGDLHPNRKEIESTCKNNTNFNCIVQTSNMAQLMALADFSIGAGGSATWERCCLGLPSMLVAFAENQINIAKNLALYGACRYLSTNDFTVPARLNSHLKNIFDDQDQIKRMSVKAFSLVDGLGVKRVTGEILG